MHQWTPTSRPSVARPERAAERRDLTLPARLTWKDQRGATRFASVVTRNVSEYGVLIETQSPLSIPLYRLVQFQLERDVKDVKDLPQSLREGRALSAVYRIVPAPYPGARHALALRLMVDPKRFTRDAAGTATSRQMAATGS